MKKRIVVGVSGASGTILAQRLLMVLKDIPEAETHLIISESARLTLARETDLPLAELMELADFQYDFRDMAAPVSSGSYATHGMIILPCSMKTVAGIYSGYSDNLLLRAADVTLKERRPLVLAPRESPLGAIHLRNLLELSRAGATILMPVLSFYSHPQTIEDMCDAVVYKALSLLGFDVGEHWRWEG